MEKIALSERVTLQFFPLSLTHKMEYDGAIADLFFGEIRLLIQGNLTEETE